MKRRTANNSLGDSRAMNTVRRNFWVIAALCLAIPGSCATRDGVPVVLAEGAFNADAGSGGLWGNVLFLNLRLESGEEVRLTVDTGAPCTILDKSLAPRLGRPLGAEALHYAWRGAVACAYRAPKLYLGNTLLRMGDRVWTDDLRDLRDTRSPTNTPNRQVQGILGMDCLRHYAVQMDFAARQMRLLDSTHLRREDLGRAFRLKLDRAGHLTFGQSFTGTRGVHPIIDTGCACDGVLEPREFQSALLRQKVLWTNEFKYPTGFVRHTALLQQVTLGGKTYTNVFIDQCPAITAKGRTYYLNAIGLPFLARHLVTFDFPSHTMYLKRCDIRRR